MDHSSSSNKQFLQQLERQRLNRSCHRVIDLRGKVAGECQAYLFGGKTHYLDDRGYLLIKQLLDHFDGRYTIGVYEAFQKAMQKLKEQQSETTLALESVAKKPLLTCEAGQVQPIPFDHAVQRREARIQYATPIEIRIDDLLYTATTVDISISALRIVLKRAYTLQQNDLVFVRFPEFDTDISNPISYRILKITHDDNHTFVVLVRDRQQDEAVTRWLDSWTQSHATAAYLDLDNELFNLATDYYQHLYTRALADPVLWLSHAKDPQPVKAWHGPVNDIQPYFKQLPIAQLLYTPSPLLVRLIPGQENSIAIPWQQGDLIAQLLGMQQEDSRYLLLYPLPVSVDTEQFAKPLAIIAEKDADYADKLRHHLTAVTMMVRILDITDFARQQPQSTATSAQFEAYTLQSHDFPPPDNQVEFQYAIHRKEPRFIIHTPLTLHTHVNSETYSTYSRDFSYQGIAFDLPASMPLKVGMHFNITFDRWQQQTSRPYFEHVPFVVKRIHRGIVHAERFIYRSNKAFNTFLQDTIEKNKNDLKEEIRHILICQESHLFGTLMTQHLHTVPLFLGLDESRKRIVQAVAATADNQASTRLSLWPALRAYTSLWADQLKSEAGALRLGIYAYQRKNKPDEWVIATDLDFDNTQQKSIFIARALDNVHPVFFYCTVSALQAMFLEQEQDLNQQLAELRSRSPHKVDHIKSVITDLFALAELTDITELITSLYHDAIVS